MRQGMGLAEAYRAYCCAMKTPYSWSARSKDGKAVAISMWVDGIDNSVSPMTYGSIGKEDISNWEWRQGNKDRLEDLIWARDHCRGRLKVIIAVPEDLDAKTRKVAYCWPLPALTMHLDELNEKTGEFKASLIEGKY